MVACFSTPLSPSQQYPADTLPDDILASAGDDGNVLVWVPAERHDPTPAFGSDALENKETWRVRHMCRSMGSEIYDLAWSPDGLFFITGSMDNVVRIFNAHDGMLVPTACSG